MTGGQKGRCAPKRDQAHVYAIDYSIWRVSLGNEQNNSWSCSNCFIIILQETCNFSMDMGSLHIILWGCVLTGSIQTGHWGHWIVGLQCPNFTGFDRKPRCHGATRPLVMTEACSQAENSCNMGWHTQMFYPDWMMAHNNPPGLTA